MTRFPVAGPPGDSASWWQSTTVRLVAILVAAQMVTLILGLAAMHSFTRQTIAHEARVSAEVVRDDLIDDMRAGGQAALLREIRERMTLRDDRNLIVVLLDNRGQRIEGNLDSWPWDIARTGEWREAELKRTQFSDAAKIGFITTPLPDGSTLITGEVLEARAQLIRASAVAFGYALLAGIIIATLAAAAIARSLQRRIDAFSGTAQQVVAGRLDARVARDRTGDAFDRLGTSINTMLDRIETLVRELRLVTDSMAHDLRSPVSRMRWSLERAERATTDATAREGLEGAIEEADGLLRMIDTSLEISRAEAGIGRDQFSGFNLAEMLHDLAEVYGPLAEEEGFKIEVAAPDALPVVAHRELLFRALSNLIDNALKYAVGGTRIDIGALPQDDGTVRLWVADDGPGIPPDRRDEALRRFGRLDPARTSSGAGLGMAFVATVAHLHGGALTLGATGDHGLTATLRFPAQ